MIIISIRDTFRICPRIYCCEKRLFDSLDAGKEGCYRSLKVSSCDVSNLANVSDREREISRDNPIRKSLAGLKRRRRRSVSDTGLSPVISGIFEKWDSNAGASVVVVVGL